MTTKETVLECICGTGKGGLTVPEFLACSDRLPQTVYPCFTQLCESKKILDSKQRRKSKSGRNSIVWVEAKYGGVVPVWGSSQPSYAYGNRAKIVMDLLWTFGPLSVAEMMTASTKLKSMSTSSLVSRLVKQKWLRKTPQTRQNSLHQTCCLYAITPRGVQVRDSSHKRDINLWDNAPITINSTEKTRG